MKKVKTTNHDAQYETTKNIGYSLSKGAIGIRVGVIGSMNERCLFVDLGKLRTIYLDLDENKFEFIGGSEQYRFLNRIIGQFMMHRFNSSDSIDVVVEPLQ